MPKKTPAQIADEVRFAPLVKKFRQEIDKAAAKGKRSLQMEVDPKKCVYTEDVEESETLQKAVKDFAKDGITLKFIPTVYASAVPHRDHDFYATW